MNTFQVFDLNNYANFEEAAANGAVYASEVPVPAQMTLMELLPVAVTTLDCLGQGSLEFRLVDADGKELERLSCTTDIRHFNEIRKIDYKKVPKQLGMDRIISSGKHYEWNEAMQGYWSVEQSPKRLSIEDLDNSGWPAKKNR